MSRFPKRPRLDGNDLPANNNNNNNNHHNNNRQDGTDNDFGFELITHEDARSLIADSMSRFHQNNSESAVVPNVIPIQPGELEVLPQDVIENNFFLQGFSEQESPLPYSQESVASNASLASTQSLNEDARSLPSFASSNYGMNLDSPAGSQPQSNAASLPIQYPNSQSSVSSQDEHEVPASASFLDRIQNTYVEPSALQALLQNIRNGSWPENNYE